MDDFSDGDFSSNPSWIGDQNDFIVNSDGQLQLNASEAGSSFLYTSSSFSDSTRWSMYAALDFAPSNSNKLAIYLAIDNPDVSIASGYRLRVGETGAEDKLILEKLENGSATFLANGTLGSMGTAPAEVSFSLEKRANDDWTLQASYKGGASTIEFTITEADDLASYNYFGIMCNYTSSNVAKFTFDDVLVEDILPDTEGPTVSKVELIDPKTLQVFFSEAVDVASAENIGNYTVQPDDINPSIASVDIMNPSLVQLVFVNDFENGVNYELEVSNVQDASSNPMSTTESLDFARIEKPAEGDLLLSEILFNPLGSGMDFIEVYNASEKFLDIDSIQIRNAVGTKIELLRTDYIMPPKSFLAISEDITNIQDTYNPPPEALFLSAELPSFNNSDGNFSIDFFVDGAWTNYESFDYTEDLHTDSIPDVDGVSLERISFKVSGSNAFIWCSALSENNYATPGYANGCTDVLGPMLIDHQVMDNQTVRLIFDDAIDPISSLDVANFILLPNAELPQSVDYSLETANEITLNFDMPLANGVNYMLEVNGIYDKVMNPMLETAIIRILLGQKPDIGQLKISEILFNPQVEAHDFIELYNDADVALSLDSLWIVNQDGDKREMLRTNFVLAPQEYVAITSDADQLRSLYLPPQEANIIEQVIPSFNQDEGNFSIGLMEDGDLNYFESFDYSDDLHFVLLDTEKGVSLERLSFKIEAEKTSNWHSASEGVLFASPGYENSNRIDVVEIPDDGKIALEEKIFSPNYDGVDDQLAILFNVEKAGYIANVKIFNDRGFLVKNVANNQLIGTQDFILWDGLNMENRVAPLGFYIALVEIFHPDGDTFRAKLPFVLAQFLD